MIAFVLFMCFVALVSTLGEWHYEKSFPSSSLPYLILAVLLLFWAVPVFGQVR